MLSFNKQKKTNNTPTPDELPEQPSPPTESAMMADAIDAIKPVRAKKDTFISTGTQFTGMFEAEGSIIVEGRIEGNITCTQSVRIEHSGQVKGEVRAQQIMINGSVEGRCYADSLSILTKGSMQGDIYADEISIEKGGLFIGQSHLMQKTPPQIQPGKEKAAPLKIGSNSAKSEKDEQANIFDQVSKT
ncbi:polymer-forming cytoskeletal protein [Serratia sp. DD3]|uniref:bactofilin family protein n=1 Tax=Serratia sp. DD3 TaxID=1410619 RepID=UPI0003C514DD|nr:polymer-forming cytoskeletal protein [Serratia sp. DD3]KEY60309.1 polymer-forming cytoskeletal [Serratia sp. DD3]